MTDKQREMLDYIDWTDAHDFWSVENFLLDQPVSYNQIRAMISYIVQDIHKKEVIIQKMKEKDKNKDTSSIEYERDCAKAALGLCEKPYMRDYKFWQDQQNVK